MIGAFCLSCLLVSAAYVGEETPHIQIITDWDGYSLSPIPIAELLRSCDAVLQRQDLEKGLRRDVLLRKVDCQLYLANFPAAYESAKRALELDPESPEILWRLGHAQSCLPDQKSQGWETAKKLMQRWPDFAFGYYLAGAYHLDIDQYEKALGFLNRAIEIKHDYSRFYLRRGMAYLRTGQYEACLRDAEMMAKLAPSAYEDHALYYLMRGAALHELGRFFESSAYLLQGKKLRPPGDFRLYENTINLILWNSFSQQEKYGSAFTVADEMTKLLPKSGEGHGLRSRSLAHVGRMEEAVREAEEAVALAPKSADAWLAKAIVRQEKGEYGNALAAYDRILNLERNQDFLVRSAFLLATCPDERYRSGKGARHIAETTFSKIKPAEHKRTARIVMALAIAECGEFKTALKTIREALKIGSPSADLVKRCKKLEALFEQGKAYRHNAARPQDQIFSIPPGVYIYTPGEQTKIATAKKKEMP